MAAGLALAEPTPALEFFVRKFAIINEKLTITCYADTAKAILATLKTLYLSHEGPKTHGPSWFEVWFDDGFNHVGFIGVYVDPDYDMGRYLAGGSLCARQVKITIKTVVAYRKKLVELGVL